MTRMTEQEAWELDERVTRAEIDLGPNGTDFLSQREIRLMGLDNLSVNYLMTKAETAHKTPAQIISELVKEKIAAST
ncbi:hypothetical protein AGMMS50256_21330 [Betaproteobacteria bacterium]|nr:hypothetical protein AGMMS50256_21330 [Betaproteobacteria bacterium]